MDEALEGGDGAGEGATETTAVEVAQEGGGGGGIGEVTAAAEPSEEFSKPEEFLKNLGEQDQPPKPLLMPPFLQDDELEAEEMTSEVTSEVTSEATAAVTSEVAPPSSEAMEEVPVVPENPQESVVSPQNETEGWAGKEEEEEENGNKAAAAAGCSEEEEEEEEAPPAASEPQPE